MTRDRTVGLLLSLALFVAVVAAGIVGAARQQDRLDDRCEAGSHVACGLAGR